MGVKQRQQIDTFSSFQIGQKDLGRGVLIYRPPNDAKYAVPRLGKISVTLHYINKGDMNGTMTLGVGLGITILVVVLLSALAVLGI